MATKTQFQKECEHALITLVRASGQRFTEKYLINGDGENFIEGRVSGIKFWIYEDKAQISIKDKDYRLEEGDYESLQQLQEEFLAIFTKLLKKKNTKKRRHKEQLNCKRCKKKWEVSWLSANKDDSIEHEITCACTKVLKTVRTAPEGPPVMILQHSKDNTVAACMPAAVAGALFPILSGPILAAVYVLSWVACGATFVNDDNRDASTLGRVAIKSLVFVSFAASVGALLGYVFWWLWQ
jgi:hypothetical protein